MSGAPSSITCAYSHLSPGIIESLCFEIGIYACFGTSGGGSIYGYTCLFVHSLLSVYSYISITFLSGFSVSSFFQKLNIYRTIQVIFLITSIFLFYLVNSLVCSFDDSYFISTSLVSSCGFTMLSLNNVYIVPGKYSGTLTIILSNL